MPRIFTVIDIACTNNATHPVMRCLLISLNWLLSLGRAQLQYCCSSTGGGISGCLYQNRYPVPNLSLGSFFRGPVTAKLRIRSRSRTHEKRWWLAFKNTQLINAADTPITWPKPKSIARTSCLYGIMTGSWEVGKNANFGGPVYNSFSIHFQETGSKRRNPACNTFGGGRAGFPLRRLGRP